MTPERKVASEQRFGPNTKAVEAMLERIRAIDWFKPRCEPSVEELQVLVDEYRLRLNAAKIPVRVIRNDWGAARDAALDAAWDVARDAAWDVARDAARGATWGAARYAARYAALDAAGDAAGGVAWGVARGVARDAAWGVARDAADASAWEVVADLMPKQRYSCGNPFESLLKVHESGCLPIGIVKDSKGKKEFAVFVPPIVDQTLVSASDK